MKGKTTRGISALLALVFACASSTALSCSPAKPLFRVALIGFEEGGADEERSALADYGKRKVEAELGAEVDLVVPDPGEDLSGLFSVQEGGYDLVVSLGEESSLAMLSARPADSGIQAVALDMATAQPPAGEGAVSLVRYRVEEGSYICGYLAGWLTGRGDHPLTNNLPCAATIGARDDPLVAYYAGGFDRGFRAASPGGDTFDYYVSSRDDSRQARSCAEEAVKKGVDIIFCTPGPFNSEVLRAAEEMRFLVVLVGCDRSSESPEHVLTSLVLRDDNAVFEAVRGSMAGELAPGSQAWGIDMGTWCIAPFHGHDPYIRRELKEKLAEEQERVAGIDFSSP